jgi:hypothetical protein
MRRDKQKNAAMNVMTNERKMCRKKKKKKNLRIFPPLRQPQKVNGLAFIYYQQTMLESTLSSCL